MKPALFLPLIARRPRGMKLADAILLYLFDEGSGDDVINHGRLAPDGTVDAGAIAWSAEGAVISSAPGTDAIELQTLTEAAIFWAFKLPANGTGDYGFFDDTENDFGLIARSYPGTPRFKFSNASAIASFGQLNDGAWHIIEGHYDGAAVSLKLDGFPLMETAAASKTATLDDIVVGALNNSSGIFPGTHGMAAVFGRALDVAQGRSVRSQIRATMEGRGVTFPDIHGLIIEGDSISAEGNIQRMPVLGPISPHARNFAVGGSSIEVNLGSGNATMRQRLLAVAAAINTCDRASIFIMIGANDLTTIGAATYMSQLGSYCEDLRAAVNVPLDIFVKVPTPQSNGTFNTARATLIPLLIAAEGSFFDVLVRTDLDPYIGPDAQGSDIVWFPDGVHPSEDTSDRMARNDLAAWQVRNGVAFSLADYDPLQWFDAQDASTILDASFGAIADGEEIGRWVDKGSDTNNAEKAGGNPGPKYRSSGVNGHPSVHVDATGTILTHGFEPAAGKEYTVVIVASVTGGQTGDRGMYSSNEAFDDKGYQILSRAGGDNWGCFTPGFNYETSGVNIQGAGLRVLTINRRGGALQFWTNGAFNGTADGSYSSGPGAIGGQLSQTTIGHYCEIAALPGPVTSEELRRIHAGLLAKWS